MGKCILLGSRRCDKCTNKLWRVASRLWLHGCKSDTVKIKVVAAGWDFPCIIRYSTLSMFSQKVVRGVNGISQNLGTLPFTITDISRHWCFPCKHSSLGQCWGDDNQCWQNVEYSPGLYTVSSRVYAQFWTARIPLFASEVILKSSVTQCESCFLNNTHPLIFPYLTGNALRVYARGYGISVTLDDFFYGTVSSDRL